MHARVSRLAARLALCVGGKLALLSGVCEANIKPIARSTALLRSFGFSGSLSSEHCSPLRCANSQRAAAALLRQHSSGRHAL